MKRTSPTVTRVPSVVSGVSSRRETAPRRGIANVAPRARALLHERMTGVLQDRPARSVTPSATTGTSRSRSDRRHRRSPDARERRKWHRPDHQARGCRHVSRHVSAPPRAPPGQIRASRRCNRTRTPAPRVTRRPSGRRRVSQMPTPSVSQSHDVRDEDRVAVEPPPVERASGGGRRSCSEGRERRANRRRRTTGAAASRHARGRRSVFPGARGTQHGQHAA